MTYIAVFDENDQLLDVAINDEKVDERIIEVLKHNMDSENITISAIEKPLVIQQGQQVWIQSKIDKDKVQIALRHVVIF